MAQQRWGWRDATVVLAICALAPALLISSPAARAAAPATGATWVGDAAPSSSISLALPLAADISGLQKFAAEVSTPGSSQYGHYASIAAVAARFGAPASERARVVGYLRRAGATGVKIDVTGLFADATMKVSQAQRLFGTQLGDFRTANAARYVAPAASFRIPAALQGAVTGVVGLDTRAVFGAPHAVLSRSQSTQWPHTAAVPAPASGGETRYDESGYLQRTGTPAGCAAATSQTGFTPNQYLTAFNYGPLQAAGLEGQGERVALIEIDGFHYSDLRNFSKCFGLATPAINGFGVGLQKPLPAGGESTLDLEVLDAAAPKLKAVDVYESQPSAVDVLHSLTAPLASKGSKPDVISASLGSCEPATLETIGQGGLRAVEGSLATAAASGISVLASSGDDGSSACLTSSGKPLPGLAVSYPASSPFVTGVGGTNIALNAANQIVGENVWNDSPLVVAAGGGGTSGLFDRPAYQDAFVGVSHRAVPDVSMLADVAPGYEIYCTAKTDCINSQHTNPWTQVGGTSAAAPFLAGGLALVDQDLRMQGRQDVGLVNPLLYTIDHSALAPGVISDVVSNDNDLGTSLVGKPFGCCTATTGYDEASGLGSVNLAGLASAAGTLVPAISGVVLSVPGQRHPVASRHLLARVTCSAHCLMGAYTQIKLGRSRRLLTQRSSTYLLRTGGRKTVTITFDTSARRKLRTALAHRERVTATVYGTVLDPGGNIEARSAGVKVRIRH